MGPVTESRQKAHISAFAGDYPSLSTLGSWGNCE